MKCIGRCKVAYFYSYAMYIIMIKWQDLVKIMVIFLVQKMVK